MSTAQPLNPHHPIAAASSTLSPGRVDARKDVGRWIRPLAYAAVYLGWGTTYLAIRVGIQSLAPASFLTLRFVLAAALLAPVLLVTKAWRGARAVNFAHSALQGVRRPASHGVL